MDPSERRAEFNRLRQRLKRIEKSGAKPSAGRGGARAFSDEDLRRIVRKRKKSPAASSASPLSPVRYKRDLPRRAPSLPAVETQGPVVRLEEAVEGVVRSIEGLGRAYIVPTPVDELEGARDVSASFERALAQAGSTLHGRLERLCDPLDLAPSDVIFMDVESTGLASSPLFLIGVMVWTESGLEVRQFLARDYAEEAAVLSMFTRECAARRLLVTFNGKSFDVPYIRARAAATGVPYDLSPVHFDLLHECRRIWKDRLPNCKLQTLERHVCNRVRHGDIPGNEIPDAYHAFVRNGNADRMVSILKHNVLDLVTLAELMTRFP
jgi:uncharacterized protein YprB with RNaseH-like and TPR domain